MLIFGRERSSGSGSFEIIIRCKTGEEFLLYYPPNENQAYIERYTAPDGRYLEFDINLISDQICLNKISDSDGNTLAEINYEQYETIVLINPGTNFERKFTLHTNGSNNTLRSFEIEVSNGEDLRTEFQYEHTALQGQAQATMSCLSQIIYPSGAEETITYGNQINLPSSAP